MKNYHHVVAQVAPCSEPPAAGGGASPCYEPLTGEGGAVLSPPLLHLWEIQNTVLLLLCLQEVQNTMLLLLQEVQNWCCSSFFCRISHTNTRTLSPFTPHLCLTKSSEVLRTAHAVTITMTSPLRRRQSRRRRGDKRI